METQNFFTKNLKWFTIAFFVLFLFKGIQSCNRGMQLNVTSGSYITQIDSLKQQNNQLRDSIKDLERDLKIQTNKALSAEQRAVAVQHAVETVKSNTTTTVVVKGVEEIKDEKNKK